MEKEKIEHVLNECEKLSFEVKGSFPEVIRKLMEIGVERYYADLVRLERTFYCKDGKSYQTKLELKDPKGIEEVFSEEGTQSAIKASQSQEIDYATFLHRVMKAGVADYTVYITGKEAQYFGRKGERWVEHFPTK